MLRNTNTHGSQPDYLYYILVYLHDPQDLVKLNIYFAGPLGEYHLPFEAEVGLQPTLEDMQTLVVNNKIRPAFYHTWIQHTVTFFFLVDIDLFEKKVLF